MKTSECYTINQMRLSDFNDINDPFCGGNLNSEYIFAYSQSDGFTWRLLKATFLVDWEFNYTLKLKAFNHEVLTKNGSNIIELSGQLSDEKLTKLESFLSLDVSQLKEMYQAEGLYMSDRGSEYFKINLDVKTKSVVFFDQLPIEEFVSDIEKKTFLYKKYLMEWVEEVYLDWLKESPS